MVEVDDNSDAQVDVRELDWRHGGRNIDERDGKNAELDGITELHDDGGVERHHLKGVDLHTCRCPVRVVQRPEPSICVGARQTLERLDRAIGSTVKFMRRYEREVYDLISGRNAQAGIVAEAARHPGDFSEFKSHERTIETRKDKD